MSSRIYFNPLDLACKSIIGAVPQGENIQLNIYFLKDFVSFQEHSPIKQTLEEKNFRRPEEYQKAYLQLQKDGECMMSYPMALTDFGWHISLKIHEIGLYTYNFYIENIGYLSCNFMEMGEISDKKRTFLLTVYSKDYKTPDWFKGGIMYQIFPDRFCKDGTMPDIKGRIARNWGEDPFFLPNAQGKILNNDFFGGNLKGIESKLEYLQDLGVTTIYLNPIFEAASNHRYDTSDYMHIDPVLGDEKDLQSLINKAKDHEITVILDGVFNHTGDDSLYFNKYGNYPSIGAYQSKESPYYSWYLFQEYPYQYESWWGIDILPEVNEYSESYQEFIFGKSGVLKHWLSYGIGGYRLDVADELPDFFLKKLRKSVKEQDEDAIIIGEVWEDASNKIAYSKRREYLQGFELDSVMNYPLKDAIIQYIQSGDASVLSQCIRTIINHYPKQTVDCLMNLLSTHDTYRILTVLGGIPCSCKKEMSLPSAFLTPEKKESAIEKLKMAVILQYTMPGVPCIYYGDENGMEGHSDPFCRRCFDWDHLRTDLIDFYKQLGKIRHDYRSIFKTGIFDELYLEDGFIFYKRSNEYGNIYIYVNNSKKEYCINLPGKFKNLLNENAPIENNFIAKKYSYGIFYKK